MLGFSGLGFRVWLGSARVGTDFTAFAGGSGR